jgi:universal stress protein E
MASSSLQRIVVAVKDPTATAPPSVAKAAQLARALNTDLVLFHGIDVPLYAEAYSGRERSLGDDEESIRKQFLRYLTAQAATLRKGGLSISVAAEWDYPAHEAVLRYAHGIGAGLIVSERHPHASSAPWGLHTTDWELLRLSAKPVLLVKDPRPYQQPVILATLDPAHRHAKPADLDADICELSETLTGALGGAWHAMHAYGAGQLASAAARASATPDAGSPDDRRTRARGALEQLLEAGALKPQSVQLLNRAPVDAILESARDLHAAIVVMGAVSRSGLKRLLIGNTAEQVIDQLPCDVLVVKPKRFSIRFSRRPRGANMLSVASTPPPR